jgi:Ran GTPase-activating protein (RanGAP) involved in mRNA processing and transport
MVQNEGPCLRQLDLRANEISDAGAAQLAEGIELNHSITHLLISDNRITDHGALALARALYRNRSLTVLWLDGAPLPCPLR